jgi:hypothetical protein
LIPRRRAKNASVVHPRGKRRNVVDHQIDFVLAARLRRMNGDLRRGQRKDQPALSDIDMREAEHVAKECAIRISVRAVDDHVGAANHGHSILPGPATAGHHD